MIVRHKRSRAFTLTELAIVLAIVGGIVGLIWAAASDVNMSSKVHTVSTELAAISHGTRAVFADQGGVKGRTSKLTPALDRLKVFPIDMRQNSSVDNGILYHPWAQYNDPVTSLGDVLVGATDCSGNAATDDVTAEPCFSVYLLDLPKKACVQSMVGTTLTGTGLQSVTINGTNVSLPIDTNTATTDCSTTSNTVQWVYLLRDNS